MKDEKNKKKPTAKKNTTKKTTKKVNNTKPVKAASKKPVAKSTKPAKKNNVPKKAEIKKQKTKKITPKAVKPTKVKPVKVERSYKPETKEEQLEKTLIFDGKQNDNLESVVTNLEKENVVLKDKVVKRSKARKVVILILALMIVGVIAGTAVYTIKELTREKINNQTTNSNIYEKVISKSSETPERKIVESPFKNIKRLSLKEFEDKVKAKEDMAVVITVETCARCAGFEEVAEKVFGEKEETLYEIDVTQYSAEEVKIFRTYYSFSQTPTLFYLKDGIVFNDIIPAVEEDDLRAWMEDVM
jgi:hypothetical protein